MNTTVEQSKTILSESALLNQLQWRYATKRFDPAQKIPTETWKALEQSLVLSPSSFGLQPWKFFVVKNEDIRKKIKAVAWNQSQVVEASHLVVFAVKSEMKVQDVDFFIKRIAEVRGVKEETLADYQKMMADFISRPKESFDALAWATKQVYIALGNFLTSAAVLGIDTCPMEGFSPEKVDEILGLPAKGYKAVVMATAGYRAVDDKYSQLPKVRFRTEDVVETI